jgi:hypothetical protein
VRITIPHYYDFGADRRLVGDDLVRPEAWDALRTRTEGPFALPATREAWERMADEREDLRERARALDAWLTEQGVRRLASYGAGGAGVELWLSRLTPERELIVTDYTPEAVERLSGLFHEADVRRHDLLADPPVDADLHLFHRIDTEFTNRQWRTLLRRFRDRTVLVVATEVATLRRILAELRALPRTRRTATRAGVIRTAGAFEALWRPTHRASRLRLHDLEAWHLVPRG